MASIGHGISDAVRKHIPVWIDDTLVDVLYEEYKKTGGDLNKDGIRGFRYKVKESSDWVRQTRKTTVSGYERPYRCKTIQKVTLIVHSPKSDMSADSYVFCVDGRPVAGGKTKLKSTHVTAAISSKDKTSVRPSDVTFVRFSEAELRKMKTLMEFGDGFEHLELERGD
jgi:hypothetical protein